MNRTAIKNFAIWARRSLREQVRTRAIQFGISATDIQEAQEVSGGLVVAGQALNADEAEQYRRLRSHLQDLMRRHKQAQALEMLVDEIAYTWFNRLAALRFMEVNGYLTTRVLSSSDPKLVDPDVLRDAGYIAEAGEFPGLNLERLNEWRSLAGRAPNPDEWLYRRLLVAQCEALAEGLPFLFDRTKNYTALFVPTNLLSQDSIVGRLVAEILEADWRDSSDSENGVEIIGWLYQFYISERKDEVIGAKSKVAAADIPAATQLFTPHWIVRYMVENSLGRLWLESHPESGLRSQMPYYLESPPEESGRVDEAPSPHPPIPSSPLTPQDLTVCDPACGSGHILVYAFDLLFAIYREQGYLERDIPGLILTHNLFGLDLDERAVQLASFAVLMKARAKNSRILRNPPPLNLVTVRSTRQLASQLAASQLTTAPAPAPLINHQLALGVRSVQLPLTQQPIAPQQANQSRLGALFGGLLTAFEDADHLGSLITPPAFDAAALVAELEAMAQTAPVFVELFAALRHLVKQAELLRKQYWVVVANPPYMGGGSFDDKLKTFVGKQYPHGKGDLFAVFMERCLEQTCEIGLMAMINQHSWMFLSSYEDLRKSILSRYSIQSMLHLGYGVFQELNSKVVQSAAFVICNQKPSTDQSGIYIRLIDFQGVGKQNEAKTLEAIANPNCGYRYHAKATDFAKIPGSPIAFWISKLLLKNFVEGTPLSKLATPRAGMITGNNDALMRFWFEVSYLKIGFGMSNREEAKNSTKKWFPYQKGGSFRRWSGNEEYVINWENDGVLIRNTKDSKGQIPAHAFNEEYIFKSNVNWSAVTSSHFSVRVTKNGALFDAGGSAAFPSVDDLNFLAGFLNSKVASELLNAINPTLNFQAWNIGNLPLPSDSFNHKDIVDSQVELMIKISKEEWDSSETSWGFQKCPIIPDKNNCTVQASFLTWEQKIAEIFQNLQKLEESNNHFFINAYGLQDELTPEVPDEQITIRRADLSRDIKSLISYAVGCMMGRYSLDHPGLIHAGQPFDPSQHTTFAADADAILPITDQAYFDDDIVSRFVEFIKTAYGEAHLRANLDFIASALTLRDGESAQDRIRRYFLTEFISDHIQTYKKRPIYWLFTSGKNKAFGALVYLHRYTPNTVAQIRTDYVLELQRKLTGEITRTQTHLDTATTAAAKKAIQRRLKTLRDQDAELAAYQAKLQTIADQRIALDLDDGVAYNYTRFKGLVYEGTDLKMADLEKKAQWKLDLLKQIPPTLEV